MLETLEEFIVRRRLELDSETARLQEQLRAIDAELQRINKVAVLLSEEPFVPPPVPAFRVIHNPQRTRSAKRVSEATIKEMVLEILIENQGRGMTALDILACINERVDVDYPRTSLSPQLSRLKADGKLHREGFLWALGGGPDFTTIEALDFTESPNPQQALEPRTRASAEAEAL